MLVLSRKENESIEFPALGVVIRVIGLTRKRVQIGIDAPISLKVARGELAAAGSVPPVPVDSIAEHVIGAEFKRIESDLAALTSFAGEEDRPRAQKAVGDLIDRMTRIKRTVSASLRERDKKVVDGMRSKTRQRSSSPSKPESPWQEAAGSDPSCDAACVQQSSVGYRVMPIPSLGESRTFADA